LALMSGCASDGATGPDDDPAGRDEIDCAQQFPDPATSPYTLPFGEGRTYAVIQGYCPANPAWGHHNWFAYDFDFAIGDTVLASRAGHVLFARDDYADGNRICGQENLIVIEHADATVLQYVHLTRNGALVNTGDTVERGQPIGLSGDTGCSSGPHLHVSLFRDHTNYDRQSTLPLNFSNAIGPLDTRGGLVQDASYTARRPDS
jgi:murein DD-endopeptidase MepM/ murein hydrolase activator NlpD